MRATTSFHDLLIPPDGDAQLLRNIMPIFIGFSMRGISANSGECMSCDGTEGDMNSLSPEKRDYHASHQSSKAGRRIDSVHGGGSHPPTGQSASPGGQHLCIPQRCQDKKSLITKKGGWTWTCPPSKRRSEIDVRVSTRVDVRVASRRFPQHAFERPTAPCVDRYAMHRMPGRRKRMGTGRAPRLRGRATRTPDRRCRA